MPDLYNDPRRKLEYAQYMAKKAPNDTSPREKAYWDDQVKTLSASRKGHQDATRQTMDEIARRQRDARSNQVNQGKPRSR